MRIYKNKYGNIAYKNYNNSQINTDVNTIGSKRKKKKKEFVRTKREVEFKSCEYWQTTQIKESKKKKTAEYCHINCHQTIN